MGQSEENHDVYNNLTEDTKKNSSAKWTVYLALCCLTACMGSFNFGFNIGALNLPTPLIKAFYAQRFAPEFYSLKAMIDTDETNMFDAKRVLANPENSTDELRLKAKNVIETLGALDNLTNKTVFEVKKEKMKKGSIEIDNQNTFLWSLTNSLFVFGGMFGAFSSKYVLESFGRKKGILFHYIFSTTAAVLAILAPTFSGAKLAIGSIMMSRFFYGIQGGMMCGIIPTYLNEVAPAALRGSCGVLNQLCITVGILFAQTLGFRQLLGTKDTWQYILGFPLITSLIGGFVMLFFFSETPKALLITNKDEDATRQVLQRLRNRTDVEDEIEEITKESKESGGGSDENVSFKELLTSKELRWSVVTSLVLQLTQQLCGINAIFFYSDGIFRRASIADEHIQYAIFATGFINVVCTIAVVPLIEKLGRKPLLVYPMVIMVIDFIVLTVFLVLQKSNIIYSYLSIACIILFICCFAVGLGPIPFIYATEVFPQNARGAALALCMTLNWISNLILSLSFEYLVKFLENYVFLVFTVIVCSSVIFLFKKLPETKNKSIEEIMAHFNGRSVIVNAEDDSLGKPMLANTKV